VSRMFGPWISVHVPPEVGDDIHRLCRGAIAMDYGLSVPEVDLLEWITEDLTVEEIMREISVTDKKAMDKRISELYSKLGVKRRPGAIRKAAEYGLIGRKTPAGQRENP
jgi:ATP/maltotriose-dependent transcriptional regulator MalT